VLQTVKLCLCLQHIRTQKKDYYALLKPDPPVSFLPLLLHLSSSLFRRSCLRLAHGASRGHGLTSAAPRSSSPHGERPMSWARRRCPRGLLHEHGVVSTLVPHSGSRSPTQRLRQGFISGASQDRAPVAPRGRRSGGLGSRARRWRLLQSSMSSPTRRPSRGLTGAAPRVEVNRSPVQKLAP
jgi:hypothetical protein